MKKIICLTVFLSFNLSFSIENTNKSLDLKLPILKKEMTKIDPVMCCDRTISTGTPNSIGYISVRVTACATSTISYQDAKDRACIEADVKAKKSLEIAEMSTGETNIR
jgi:hypothetical protein